MKQGDGHNLGPPPAVQGKLTAYHELVRRYHRTLDLVSNAALDRFPELIRQALEYADTIERAGQPGKVLDVGSGVGLPGVVVAVALPHRAVLLVERRRRRATFLRMVVAQLGLSNADVTEADVRDVTVGGPGAGRPERSSADAVAEPLGFAVVTAQAVAGLSDVYCLTRHLHAESVMLVARKGPAWGAEVEAVRDRIGATPAVRAETALPGSGTLVAIEVPGGLPCPPSG